MRALAVKDVARGIGAGLVLASVAWSPLARAQACCAGTGVVTPARLAMHEDALAGLTLRGAGVIGSYDANAHFAGSPSGTSEVDLEQDLFGALRVLGRGQVALLVPMIETHRAAQGASETGGGLGDVNASGRYDFVDAGRYRFVPGVAVLAGITFPTGTPPEKATTPLATAATGVGSFQGNLGLALEQTFGPWLVNVTGIVAARAARHVDVGGGQEIQSRLAPQITGLAALAYTFPNDAALAVVLAYTGEGDAIQDGVAVSGTARHIVQTSLAGTLPVTDRLRLQGSLFAHPPLSSFGANLPALTGLSLTGVFSWS